MARRHIQARERLLEAARDVVRAKGFSATSIDDLCRSAGVTKGAFFHHFRSKEDLGVEAARFWAETTSELFANAPYHQPADPFDRLIAYLEFRKLLLAGEVPEFTCLVGTMVQETYDSAPAIRQACDATITGHAMTLVPDIQAAMAACGVTGTTAESLALHTQAVLQGAFIMAKARGSAEIAADTIDHLIRYIRLLFNTPTPEEIRQ
ncbi:TetR/AcrR family transcriptional regulator [Pseudohoeflea suaedae]|uniref:TetR/AcrR family transcriptional regulator n=1 Tax=Pseudohoeflea suaedae TaxID=877384 RepID=A0A4R5PPC7_9HYPH|nr:TetR/AcrR family transcriptional regulator [Pseudohoeflea suaedae]TDH38932.1 TetR/AcrR family transcriptional regulator [Pseudohoeflea suaedae]